MDRTVGSAKFHKNRKEVYVADLCPWYFPHFLSYLFNLCVKSD